MEKEERGLLQAESFEVEDLQHDHGYRAGVRGFGDGCGKVLAGQTKQSDRQHGSNRWILAALARSLGMEDGNVPSALHRSGKVHGMAGS